MIALLTVSVSPLFVGAMVDALIAAGRRVDLTRVTVPDDLDSLLDGARYDVAVIDEHTWPYAMGPALAALARGELGGIVVIEDALDGVGERVPREASSGLVVYCRSNDKAQRVVTAVAEIVRLADRGDEGGAEA
jgi:hypothetical protein